MKAFDFFCEKLGIDPGDPYARDLYREWEETLPKYWIMRKPSRGQEYAEIFVVAVITFLLLLCLISTCN